MKGPTATWKLLDYAEYYVNEFGWSVVPLYKKLPPKGFDLTKCYTCRTPWKELKDLIRKHNPSGIGIVGGKVSGNLGMLDFDSEELYQDWKHRNLKYADKLPTTKTARGYHTYLTTKDLKSRTFGIVEFRSEGQYVVAPPSLHQYGCKYKWLIEPTPGHIPFVDCLESFFTHPPTQLAQ